MIGDAEFNITEWDWLKLSLDVLGLRSKGNYVSTHYQFDDTARTITCLIHWSWSDNAKKEKVSREKNLEVYLGWYKSQVQQIKQIMERLPQMKASFDFNKHFILKMLQETPGMSPNLICRFEGNKVVWGPSY